jgi:hypothetical protein
MPNAISRSRTGRSADEIQQLNIKEGDRNAEIVQELLIFSRNSNDRFSWVTVEALVNSVLTLTR